MLQMDASNEKLATKLKHKTPILKVPVEELSFFVNYFNNFISKWSFWFVTPCYDKIRQFLLPKAEQFKIHLSEFKPCTFANLSLD